MDNGYSLSDIASATGGEGFGGSSAWVLIILFALIFGWGGNGFGGSNGATSADIQRAVDLNAIQSSIAGVDSEIQRGIYEINNNTNHVAYDNLGEIRDVQASVATSGANIINNLTALQANMQNCCCTTQRAIDSVNYNLASQSAAIQANDTANTQKILDKLSANREADLMARINQLEMAQSMCGVVRYPMQTSYCSGANPFSSCGCNAI